MLATRPSTRLTIFIFILPNTTWCYTFQCHAINCSTTPTCAIIFSPTLLQPFDLYWSIHQEFEHGENHSHECNMAVKARCRPKSVYATNVTKDKHLHVDGCHDEGHMCVYILMIQDVGLARYANICDLSTSILTSLLESKHTCYSEVESHFQKERDNHIFRNLHSLLTFDICLLKDLSRGNQSLNRKA